MHQQVLTQKMEKTKKEKGNETEVKGPHHEYAKQVHPQ